ncbi:MAG: hypothetical protein QGG40_22675, partial [Myxococcota bacterium]|nr:hypothetical protein [Myxococcota bacterium]
MRSPLSLGLVPILLVMSCRVSPGTDKTTDTATDDTAEADDTGPESWGGPCPGMQWLETAGSSWSYTRPPSDSMPFDEAIETRSTLGKVGEHHVLETVSYVHWDGSNEEYPYIGTEDTTSQVTLLCSDQGVWLVGVEVDFEGYGGAWGSTHAWGVQGTITLEPPVLVWQAGARAGDSWSTGTVATWDDDFNQVYGDYEETWTFTVQDSQSLDTVLGTVEARPIVLERECIIDYGA